MPENMLDFSNLAQASWELYFELIGLFCISVIGQSEDLLELLSYLEGQKDDGLISNL